MTVKRLSQFTINQLINCIYTKCGISLEDCYASMLEPAAYSLLTKEHFLDIQVQMSC